MFFSFSGNKNSLDRINWIILLIFPFLTSCSSNQNNIVEIITPPKLPMEFLSIPDLTENPQLISLLSADDKIKDIAFGRKDPFLPPHLDGGQLLAPSSFKYHGQISTSNIINAFVSYEDRRGTIKPGDVGGESTDLLPIGWTFLSLDIDTEVLTLLFESRSVEVDLFPKE